MDYGRLNPRYAPKVKVMPRPGVTTVFYNLDGSVTILNQGVSIRTNNIFYVLDVLKTLEDRVQVIYS